MVWLAEGEEGGEEGFTSGGGVEGEGRKEERRGRGWDAWSFVSGKMGLEESAERGSRLWC